MSLVVQCCVPSSAMLPRLSRKLRRSRSSNSQKAIASDTNFPYGRTMSGSDGQRLAEGLTATASIAAKIAPGGELQAEALEEGAGDGERPSHRCSVCSYIGRCPVNEPLSQKEFETAVKVWPTLFLSFFVSIFSFHRVCLLFSWAPSVRVFVTLLYSCIARKQSRSVSFLERCFVDGWIASLAGG